MFDKNIPIVPIPFFGNLKTAKIITIGANPSATELRNNGWTEDMDENQISEKLIQYFHNKPHKWFEPWETTLNTVGLSYYDDTAAHIDLCPCATKSLSTLQNLGKNNESIELFKQSVPFFIEGIKQCTDMKFVFMAGTVTKNYWLNEFLYKFVNTTDFKMQEKPSKPIGSFISKHELIINNKSVYAIFSTSSPSATEEKKKQLPKRIEENNNFILEHL